MHEQYEGAIVRVNTKYIFSYKGRRNRGLLKFKKVYDNEYDVKGISQGTGGKAKGTILFEFETPNGKRFTVTPKGPLKFREELYKKLMSKDPDNPTKTVFESKVLNHKMRVHYEELSKDNVPLRARIEEIYIRPFGE